MERIDWEEDRSDFGYAQLVGILWRRRFWLIGTFLATIALAIPVILMKKPLYMSHMNLLVESNYQSKENERPNNGQYLEQEFTDFGLEIDYATQLELMRSSYLLEKVIEKLGIREFNPEKNQNPVEELRESLTVSRILEKSQNKDGTETKIIQAKYFSDNPLKSKKVLETIRDVYLEYNLVQQEKRLRDGLDFINARIPEARKELIAVEEKLTKLRRENDLISPERESEAIESALSTLQQQRTEVNAETEQIKGQYLRLQQQLGLSEANSVAIARLNESSRYQSLLNKLQETEIALADKQARFTDESPFVTDLLAQKNNQKTLLLQEVERILGKIPPNFEVQLESLLEQGKLVSSKSDFITALTQSQADLTGLAKQKESLAQTEIQLRRKLTQFPELIAQHNNLVQEATIKRDALQRLLGAKQELEIELSRGAYNWQVVESPQLGEQISPNTTKDILLSLIVATFLGGSAAFLSEVLDDRLYNSRQIKEKIALPFLGSAPGLPMTKHERFIVRLPFMSPHESSLQEIVSWQPFRESLDLIYENLQRLGSSFAFQSLAVTSAVPGEGKSTLILGLASSIARHQKRVLVIDADLRCSSLHEKLGLENKFGLTDWLQETTASPNIQRLVLGGENIDLLTSGSKTTDPVKLLGSAKFKQSLQELEATYDLILVDTPPVLGMVDAIKVSACCRATIMVTRLNQVKTAELMEAVDCLDHSKVLGIVANDSLEINKLYQKQPQYLLTQEV